MRLTFKQVSDLVFDGNTKGFKTIKTDFVGDNDNDTIYRVEIVNIKTGVHYWGLYHTGSYTKPERYTEPEFFEMEK